MAEPIPVRIAQISQEIIARQNQMIASQEALLDDLVDLLNTTRAEVMQMHVNLRVMLGRLDQVERLCAAHRKRLGDG